jgi:hypothetical protein
LRIKALYETGYFILAGLGFAFRRVRRADGDFAKVGVENGNSDLATFLRTIVILCVLAGILTVLGSFSRSVPYPNAPGFFSCCRGWRPARPGCVISGR